MRHFSKPFPVGKQPQKRATNSRPTPPLEDSRYLELMQRASAFFAESEQDREAEKASAIAEICDLMAKHGITPADLL